MRIYIGNLTYDTTEDELRQLFTAYGEVTSVSIPVDRDSRQPKGFGFVDMPQKAEAEAAIAALNSKMHKGRALTVSEARPRAEVGAGGGGYGRGGGARDTSSRRGPRRY